MPSTPIKTKIKKIVILGLLGKIPLALSVESVIRTTLWTIAGRMSNLVGKAGMPSEMDERERKTNVW